MGRKRSIFGEAAAAASGQDRRKASELDRKDELARKRVWRNRDRLGPPRSPKRLARVYAQMAETAGAWRLNVQSGHREFLACKARAVPRANTTSEKDGRGNALLVGTRGVLFGFGVAVGSILREPGGKRRILEVGRIGKVLSSACARARVAERAKRTSGQARRHGRVSRSTAR